MKRCRGCDQMLALSEYYAHRMMTDGRLHYCKTCVRERIRQYRLEHDTVREQERARYASGKKQPKPFALPRLAKIAHLKVRYAVQRGRLERPARCEECGVGDVPIEAAHYDYQRPLDVRWLCRRCHRRWDAAEPKVKGLAPF